MKKIKKYFNGVQKEVKRVRWPKKNDMIKYSISTIVFICFFAGFFYLFDTVSALIAGWIK